MSQHDLNRRRFVAAAAGVIGGGSLGARASRRRDVVALGSQPAGLPNGQHNWTATLATDATATPVSPRFDRLLFFDLQQRPTATDVRRLEAALRTLERLYPWGPEGLLFTVGWGPHYFEHVLSVSSPIPRPKGLSDFELPTFDNYDLVPPPRLRRRGASRRDRARARPRQAALGRDRSTWAATSAGARHEPASSAPDSRPPTRTPTASRPATRYPPARRSSWASSRASRRTRRARTTSRSRPAVRRRNDHAGQLHAPPPRQLVRNPRRAGTGRAHVLPRDHPGRGRTVHRRRPQPTRPLHAGRDPVRRRRPFPDLGPRPPHGKPRIIRRDFNTVDGGLAGLHFVSVQRSIADFVATRNAMNAANASYLNPAITDTSTTGSTSSSSSSNAPTTSSPHAPLRSYPLFPGQAAALA